MESQKTMNFEETPLSYEEALAKFLAHANDIRREYFAKNYPNVEVEPVVLDGAGKKFQRLATVGPTGQAESCYCFVEKSTGDVLKSASWKTPAKHARGNIFEGAKDPSKYGVAEHGAHYL